MNYWATFFVKKIQIYFNDLFEFFTRRTLRSRKGTFTSTSHAVEIKPDASKGQLLSVS